MRSEFLPVLFEISGFSCQLIARSPLTFYEFSTMVHLGAIIGLSMQFWLKDVEATSEGANVKLWGDE